MPSRAIAKLSGTLPDDNYLLARTPVRFATSM